MHGLRALDLGEDAVREERLDLGEQGLLVGDELLSVFDGHTRAERDAHCRCAVLVREARGLDLEPHVVVLRMLGVRRVLALLQHILVGLVELLREAQTVHVGAGHQSVHQGLVLRERGQGHNLQRRVILLDNVAVEDVVAQVLHALVVEVAVDAAMRQSPFQPRDVVEAGHEHLLHVAGVAPWKVLEVRTIGRLASSSRRGAVQLVVHDANRG